MRAFQNCKWKKEVILKSMLFGSVVALGFVFAISFISYLFGIQWGIYLAISLGLILGLISGIVGYFKLFPLNDESKARRLDSLGLQERIITMVQLTGDDSFIAQKQRDDALYHLNQVNSSDIKIKIPRKMILFSIVGGCLAIISSLLSILSNQGVIKPFNEIINPTYPIFIELEYDMEGDGIIDGDLVQIVELNKDIATPVYAEASDGWVFVEWSDGNTDPYRHDINTKENLSVTAIFEELNDSDMMDNSNENSGDGIPTDMPGEPSDNSNGGDSNQPGDPNAPPADGSSGRYEERNQILDGKTPYQSLSDVYTEEAIEQLTKSSNSYDKSLIDTIESYFNRIYQ